MKCSLLFLLIFLFLMCTLVTVGTAIPVFSWLVFAYYIVFYLLLLIYLYLYIWSVFSYRQHIAISCFLIQPDSPCFLIRMFRLFTFSAIIYNIGIISTILFFSFCFIYSLFLFTPFPDFLWITWMFYSIPLNLH